MVINKWANKLINIQVLICHLILFLANTVNFVQREGEERDRVEVAAQFIEGCVNMFDFFFS